MAQSPFISPLQNITQTSDRLGYEGLPPELGVEEQAINRRQQLANYLMQQGLAQASANNGQMVGRFYVAGNPLQNLAGLVNVGAGVYGNYKADQDRQGVAKTSSEMLAKAMQDYKEASAPVVSEGARPTAQIMPPPSPGYGLAPQPARQPVTTELPGPGAPVETMPTPDARRQAIIEHLVMNRHPQASAAGKLLLGELDKSQAREDQQAFLKAESALNRENRLAVTEGQLNQALIMGLITKDQKDQMLSIQKKAEEDRATNAKAQLDLEREKMGQGKTPPGYRATAKGELEAIPGGPADVKKEAVFNQDTAMLQTSTAGMDRLAESANQLLAHPGLAGITGLRGAVPDIPGTQAADARALLNKLKSQVGFSVLQEMRNNSKTGGALGAVSDAEGKRLENNLASVESAQSIDQMRSELKGIIDYATGAKDRLREAFNMKHKAGEPTTKAPAPAPSGKVRKYNPATGKIE